MTMLLLAATAITAYVVSIFTWPHLRRVMIGIDAEVESLRARMRALETRLRG